MLIRIKQSKVGVLRRFLRGVLIRFIEENARSHSAVLTGVRAAMVDSFVSWGNMSHNVLLVQRSLSISLNVIDEY